MAQNWPDSVVGSWNIVGNQAVGMLAVTTQGATGLCRSIDGSIYGDTIEGFYCPFSGRIFFGRRNSASNDISQVWSGNLSQTGTVLRIGGSFAVINPSGGVYGEYNFSASK